ncbi:hypothetical protein [Hydrogenophaga sp.]|uniref:hypothetical protein n=1 Tax=Hydrogenophaga sp. TaxID=1904254 RepID=UPI0025B999FB|nr:hypothetical protein [Hydrogenophaga sp.]MBT9467103.1 hypothetical protein [Hydrogenophaga sp.]
MARVSEGTRTAQLLLEEFPLPERPPFYIFPRTLEEAFGPGRRGLEEAPEQMHPRDKVVLKAGTCGLVALALMAVAGTLP